MTIIKNGEVMDEIRNITKKFSNLRILERASRNTLKSEMDASNVVVPIKGAMNRSCCPNP